jgi:hypothetical protein
LSSVSPGKRVTSCVFSAFPQERERPAKARGKSALTGVDPFIDKRPPDVKALLTRIIALEDLEDVQASQANHLTDLERQVFLLQAKPHYRPRATQC